MSSFSSGVRAIAVVGFASLSCSRATVSTDVAPVAIRDTALGARVPLGARPFGAAISPEGVAYVTQLDAGWLARADAPSQAFASVVAVGRIPTEVVFSSTGTRAYVANQHSQNIGVVDVGTNTQIDVIDVIGDPFAIVVPPGDSIIYVTTNANHVYGIRLTTKDVIFDLPVPATANGFVVRADTLLYVSTRAGGSVIEINLKTRTVARTLAVGGMPQKMVLSPDGNELYIANEGGYVQFWNLVTGEQIGPNLVLPGNSAGYAIARRPNTGQLYVTTAYFGGGKIHVIDPTTRTVTRTFGAGGSTRQVVFSASGTVGFVPNEGGWIDFLK